MKRTYLYIALRIFTMLRDLVLINHQVFYIFKAVLIQILSLLRSLNKNKTWIKVELPNDSVMFERC